MSEVSIVPLTNIEELRELLRVFSRAFENDYNVGDRYLEELLKNNSTRVFGAIRNGSIVGGVVACELLPIHGAKEIYIYDIAVEPRFQQQGIGKIIFKKLEEYAKRVGAKTIFVEAEAEDTGAVTFYRKLNGEEVLVNHFNFNVSG